MEMRQPFSPSRRVTRAITSNWSSCTGTIPLCSTRSRPARRLADAASHGLSGEINAMTASCDSWLYNNTLGIPSVVFGPGSLSVAHSREEHIRMDDIERAAVSLITFAANWCGRA